MTFRYIVPARFLVGLHEGVMAYGRRWMLRAQAIQEAELKRAELESQFLRTGVPPHVVAARLGHSVIMLMQTYAHALPGQQRPVDTIALELDLIGQIN